MLIQRKIKKMKCKWRAFEQQRPMQAGVPSLASRAQQLKHMAAVPVYLRSLLYFDRLCCRPARPS